jgi:hypothetical protein
MHNKKTAAFTFIELSIVLIAIAFIAGSITLGQSLIQTSKLRQIITELNYYMQAVKTFQTQYNGLPGDLATASIAWSGATDGNGDGRVGAGTGADLTGEPIIFWRHLTLSGLIDGNYTGAIYSLSRYHKAGYNLPGSKSNDGMYYFYYHPSIFGKAANGLTLARAASGAASQPWANGILSSRDAQMIDVKMDDGLASSGMLYSARGDDYTGIANKCVSADFGVASATYTTDYSDACRLFYWIK